MIPTEWLMPAVVLGMVLALVFAAGLLRRYQQYKAQQRAQVRRIASAIPIIEEALTVLGPVPLSRNLRILLRGDVQNRYQTIRQLHPRYPEIERCLQEARSRQDSEGPDSNGSVPPIEDEQQFTAMLRAIDNLTEYLERGGPIAGYPVDRRMALLAELKERRAEVLARFHIVQASREHAGGDSKLARRHLHTLMGLLRERGPNTEFVRALYQEADKLHHDYTLPSGPQAVVDSAPENAA